MGNPYMLGSGIQLANVNVYLFPPTFSREDDAFMGIKI